MEELQLSVSTADQQYAEMVHGSEAHQQLIASLRRPSKTTRPDRWQPGAARFREDPFRTSPTLEALRSFLEPDDVVLDIGGGAGRYLPLAQHCREWINVEPSAGMGQQFEASVHDAGIANARWVERDWLSADIEGDVCFSANVVHYVADIRPFIAKLDRAGARRVMLVMHSVPPVNVGAKLSACVYGVEPRLDPGHRELMPILWDMGLLPEVHVLGSSDFIAERQHYATRREAIDAAVPEDLVEERRQPARTALEEHFDELFVLSQEGSYRRRRDFESRVLLITWTTGAAALER